MTCYTILYYNMLYCNIVWCGVVLCGVVWCGVAQYSSLHSAWVDLGRDGHGGDLTVYSFLCLYHYF